MRVILILCFFPCLQKFLFAQETGLVMSGGGAKGIAHVGVIKALEEYNVPIDYVAGTSMGGIVAGMYAAGYSAAQIEGIMLSPLFLRWVNGKFDQGYRYHLYAEEANSSVAVVKLSLDSTLNVSLNSSIASDVALNFALPEYLSRASAIARGNFDSLFVPARIMAADVFTQTEIALDSGSLPLALRATLSVPFFYKPVKVGGKYLFDGGLYNNFPADVMKRDFDPDVIIGCNVSSKVFDAYPYEEDDKLVGNSLLFMLLNKSDPGLIPDSGIYIEPNLSSYNSFDFSKAKALIDSGYQATIRQMEQIKSKITTAVSASDRALQRAHFHSRGASFVFDRMEFHGYNSKQQRYMIKLFGLDKRDELTLEDIKKSYFKMMSEKYFATVYPDVGFNARTGKYAFELHGRPRSNLNVKGGGTIATRNISQIFLGAEYYYFNNYLLKNSLSFYAGSFYKSARLQSRLYLAGYNPIFIEPELIYNNWDFINSDDFFLHHETSTVLRRTDRKYALNIGLPVGSKFKTVLSAALINNQDDFGSTAGVISSDTLDILKLEGFKGKFLIERNNFNRKQYPTEGKSFRLSVNYLNVEETYEQRTTSVRGNTMASHAWVDVEGAWEQYFKKGKWTTGYLLEGAYTTRRVFSGYFGTLINLPAFNPLQDSPTLLLQNFRAFSFAAMGIKNVFSIKPILDFRLEGHIFKPFEIVSPGDGFAGRSRASADQLFLAATSGLVLHSPLGPVSLSLNYYDDESRWGVLMHIGFLLFNDNSLGY